MKTRMFVVAVALAFAVSACSGASSPTAPSVPPGTPTSGTITATWQRPAGEVCQSAGSEWSRCNTQPKIGWATSYPTVNVQMNDSGNGVFTAAGVAEAGQNKISVFDPWKCPPAPGCQAWDAMVGSNISVNGVRLKDGINDTAFKFIPPDTIIPQ